MTGGPSWSQLFLSELQICSPLISPQLPANAKLKLSSKNYFSFVLFSLDKSTEDLTGEGVSQENVSDKKSYPDYSWELYRLTTKKCLHNAAQQRRINLEPFWKTRTFKCEVVYKPLLRGFVYLTCSFRFISSLIHTGLKKKAEKERVDSACHVF